MLEVWTPLRKISMVESGMQNDSFPGGLQERTELRGNVDENLWPNAEDGVY